MKERDKHPRELVQFQRGGHIKLFMNTEPSDYSAHWHIPAEVVMPIENGYTVICGNTRREIKEGELALIAPGAVHALEAPSWGRRLFLQADLSGFEEIREIQVLFSVLPPVIVFGEECGGELCREAAACIRRIQAECVSGQLYGELSAYAELFRLFSLVGKHFARQQEKEGEEMAGMRRCRAKIWDVCGYIREHLAEPITLEQAAEAAGFSKYHFAHLFREMMGVSFYRYLNQKRIMHAQQLLLDPDYTVAEAALESGFPSISSFNRMFRQINGCTPTKYRKYEKSY